MVIIFTDDLGYGDIGVFGAKGYSTPHLDTLATQGRVFRNFHVAQAVCSASRAGLMTGCYPNRIGIHGALGPKSRVGIHENETTLAEVLKSRGYATAIFGKWHLGDSPQFLPVRHGFDQYFGLPYSNDMWPHHPEFAANPAAAARKAGFPELPLIENDRVVNPKVTSADQEQLTTWYTEHAVQFIEKNSRSPFFLYLAHSMPHVPLHVSSKFKGKTERGLFGDVIAEIDWSVGQVLAALDRLKLRENTLVIFTSDNGPWLSYGGHAGSSGPLREGKGTSWEGGTRVPCIMSWPKRLPAGTESQQMFLTIDLLPTIARLTGADLPALKIDGMDVWPIISGAPGATNPHAAYWTYYEQNQLQAITSGDGRWKLQLPHTFRTLAGATGKNDGTPIGYKQRKIEKPELYDLTNDVAETKDVAEQNADVVRTLLAEAEVARAELGDSLTNRKGTGVREPGRIAQE